MLSIVAVGVALAAFNVYFRYATTDRIHRRWGTPAMLRIAESPRAEWWELAPTDANAQPAPQLSGRTVETAAEAAAETTVEVVVERIALDGQTLAVRRRGPLIDARGFVHLRNALGQNASYDWSREAEPPNRWRWAIAFVDDQDRTVLLFDEPFRVVRTFQASEPVALTDKMSAGLTTFFAEQNGRADDGT